MGDWGSGSPRNYRQLQQQPQPHQQGGVGFQHCVGRGGRCGRPPRSSCKPGRLSTSEFWKPVLPYWEKDFCYHVGSVPWKKVLESKSLLPLYKNVAVWDDSACEESFHNAKARYWAHINGLACDIPLPDPDKYIDEIDWNADPDPELIADLENRTFSPPSDEEGKKSSFLTSGWETFFLPKEEAPYDGWFCPADENPPVTSGCGYGDKKEDTDHRNEWAAVEAHEKPQITSGWGDWENTENGGCNYGWGDRVPQGAAWDKGFSQGKRGNSSRRWHKNRPWGPPKTSKNDSDCYHHHRSEPRRYGKKRDGNAGQRDIYRGHWDGDNYHQMSNNNIPSYCRGRRRTGQANVRAPYYEHSAPEPWNAFHGRMGQYDSGETTGVNQTS